MRESIVSTTSGAVKAAAATLAPSIMTWEGIWNMVWIAGFTLRNQGVRGDMEVSFWWGAREDISLEARAVL